MQNVHQLPPHRFRLNALLGRELGEMGAYRRVRDHLWSDGRTLEKRLDLPFCEVGPRSFPMSAVTVGPDRAPCRVQLSLGPEHSTTALRFEAQRLTLESAVDASPSLWGTAAHIDVDIEELAPGERRGLVLTAMRLLSGGGSLLDPWCPAARLLLEGVSETPGRAFLKIHPLRALRGAVAEGLHRPAELEAQAVRAALHGWRGGPTADRKQPPEGRIDLVVVGGDARTLAAKLAVDHGVRVVRAADESTLYTPSDALAEDGTREMVSTGPFDIGVLSEPAEALVLLPGGPPIDREQAENVRASVVLELGSGLVLPEADATLAGRRIEVVPDLVFSSAQALACVILRRSAQRRVAEARQRLSIEVARLVREALVAAGERGRSLRDQLYLRALGNLQR